MMQLLVAKLKENGSTKDWSHITDQIGMFGKRGQNDFPSGIFSTSVLFASRGAQSCVV
jgi:hypothetical protein